MVNTDTGKPPDSGNEKLKQSLKSLTLEKRARKPRIANTAKKTRPKRPTNRKRDELPSQKGK
jgi:hypothetical protein